MEKSKKPIPVLERAIKDMPAFPQSVQRVLAMTGDIHCTPRDLVDILERDPVLTGKILKLVNSAFFSLAHRVDSVRHALVYLGLNTVKHLAMGLAAVGAMPRTNKSGISTEPFLKKALATGEVCRISGGRLGGNAQTLDQMYLLGLFHNLGDVLCAVHTPMEWEEYLKEKNVSQEKKDAKASEMFGLPPRELGAMVVDAWEMEATLGEAIRGYQCEGIDNPDTLLFRRGLQIATEFVHCVGEKGFDNRTEPLKDPEAERVLALLLEYPTDVIESIGRSQRFILESNPGQGDE